MNRIKVAGLHPSGCSRSLHAVALQRSPSHAWLLTFEESGYSNIEESESDENGPSVFHFDNRDLFVRDIIIIQEQ